MNVFFVILNVLIFATILYASPGSKSLTGSYHPRYINGDNANIPLEIDCALRAFTIEMAAYIAPLAVKTNWTTLSASAFQMNQCNYTSQTAYKPSPDATPFKTAPEMKKGACLHTVYVHDLEGNDLFDGTFKKPMKTIQRALSVTRTLRAIHGSDSTLCITLRGGTYYLGTNATSSSSAIGAIALTSSDSNLVIENYENERVVLSGGTLLQLQWSVHAKTAAGGVIMKAQVPSSVDLDRFNELYIDDVRAIVAKYPNGDPSTQGLYAKDPGFSFGAQSWVPPVDIPSVDIHIASPVRNGTSYSNFRLGIGGGANVFNPPASHWSAVAQPGVGHYVVPKGFTVNNGALPHISNWSKPTTGIVHAFHAAYWATWAFEIASVSAAQNTIMFGRGGFQEGQGSTAGSAFYVSNIFEELDSPNEWFVDKDTRTLYFMPNGTMPNVFVASQIPCLISMSGSSIKNTIQNVLVQGLILTHTSHTYLKDYTVPSGGDWSVHRGGTIYLTNTRYVTITNNLFTQLGSNGVAVIDYNDATSITLNEFVWLADSGIIFVGSTKGIDGFSVASQPANALVQSNLIHETGIYGKQTSPLFISISRSISVIGNLMFNMPRAAININDGFHGNHTISYNVIFNTVRETSDHGPINTWDRQPYLTDAVQPGVPSFWQLNTNIHHNTIFSNYRALWPLDHDDGSAFYEASYNFLIYGGKKNYLGHSKADHNQIYAYPDVGLGEIESSHCLNDYFPVRGSSGWNESWFNNTCVLYSSSEPYNIGYCDTANLFVPYLAFNKIFIPAGSQVGFVCAVGGGAARLSLEQWQSFGLDPGTTVGTTPDVQTIIEWGRKMLQGTI